MNTPRAVPTCSASRPRLRPPIFERTSRRTAQAPPWSSPPSKAAESGRTEASARLSTVRPAAESVRHDLDLKPSRARARRAKLHVLEKVVDCLSPRHVEANMDAVTHFVATRDGGGGIPFSRAIRALLYPEVTLPPAHAGPRLVWGRYDAAGVSPALRDLMAVETTLEPRCAYTDAERRRLQPVVSDGLRRLRRTFPETYPVFCRAVPFLILAKSESHAGGSISSRIGIAWLAPSSSWTGQDCGEHLYHEYVHQCLFLEEMVRTVFRRDPNAMSKPENMIVSAIRQGEPRRYNQSYHSAFVAAAVIEYRARTGRTCAARSLFPALWPCLDALARKGSDLLTDNGAEQLDQLIEYTARQAGALQATGGYRSSPAPA